MEMVRHLRARVGAVTRAFCRREARRFLHAAKNCRATQTRTLLDLLALNGGSRFSRDHRLDGVRTISQFRRRLPVSDYEYFRPYIEEVKAGRTDSLLGAKNRLLMFSLTSGTTAQSKYIPITQRFLDDYRSGWQTWGIQALDAHPGVNSRHILQLSSDYDLFRTPGGTPCGNISGLVAACQKRIVRTMYTVPSVVSKIRDSDSKLYTAMRLAIADRYVGMVMTANPSTLIQLAKLADTRKEDLIRDIADGTLSSAENVPGESSPSARQADFAPTSGAGARARGDRRSHRHPVAQGLLARDAAFGHLDRGSGGAYLSTLRRYFGEIPVRDHGLSASEGRMTIPVADHSTDGILDVTSHFFEFVPEEEYGRQDALVLEAHELEEGRNYYILLTTSSGLYRYNIFDVVRCTGFYHSTPTIEFLHKGAHIANVTGEKISESQVVDAVRTVSDQMRLTLSHFTVSPVWGDPPRYQLLVERGDVGVPVGDSLAHQVDERLKLLNCEYKEKRATGRLAPMKWMPLPDGTWTASSQKSRRKNSGGSLEQYKHPCLVPDLEFGSKLFVEMAAFHNPIAVDSSVGDAPEILTLPDAQREAARRAAG